jgi:hypothetical protein
VHHSDIFGAADAQTVEGANTGIPVDIAHASADIIIDHNHFEKFTEAAAGDRAHNFVVEGNTFRGFADSCFNFHGTGTYGGIFRSNICDASAHPLSIAGTSTTEIPITSTGASRDGTGAVTITTTVAHGLSVGDVVSIAGVGTASVPHSSFDGRYTVTGVIPPPPAPSTTFTYSQSSTLGTENSGNGVVVRIPQTAGVLMLAQQPSSGPEKDHLIEGNVVVNYGAVCIGAYASPGSSCVATVGDIEGVTIRGNKCLNQINSLGALQCILVEDAHNAMVTENECGKINDTGILVDVSDQVTLANNRVDAGGAVDAFCVDIEDTTHAVVSGNMVTGCVGPGAIGIKVGATLGAGSTDQVTLTGNQAFGNGDPAALNPANYAYVPSAPGTITKLTRFGNLNDNFGVIGGAGSRVLDTFVTTAGTGSVPPNGNGNNVTVTWPVTLPSTNYGPVCTVQEPTGTTTLSVDHVVSQTTSQSVVRVVNYDASTARTGTLNCVALFR